MTSVLVREFKCQVGVSWSTSWIMWHKCIHMRAESRGKEPLLWPARRSALWEGKHAADGSFSFVFTATAGDPLGNASLLNWGASNASLEQRRKSVLPNASQSNFYILCNGNCGNGVDVTNKPIQVWLVLCNKLIAFKNMLNIFSVLTDLLSLRCFTLVWRSGAGNQIFT